MASGDVVRNLTILRRSQIEALKTLAAEMYDDEYMRAPAIAELIRVAIDAFLALPAAEQQQLVAAEFRPDVAPRYKNAFVDYRKQSKGQQEGTA